MNSFWLKKSSLSGDTYINSQGLVLQSIVSLMSSLVVKMLTVLVSTIYKSRVFLLKNVSSFCKSYSHFFSKNISIMPYLIINYLTIHYRMTSLVLNNWALIFCGQRKKLFQIVQNLINDLSVYKSSLPVDQKLFCKTILVMFNTRNNC